LKQRKASAAAKADNI